MKFIINENGYYAGYSPNGAIPMNEEFNLSNFPTSCHYFDFEKNDWVLDIVSNLDECKELLTTSLIEKYNEAIEAGYVLTRIEDEIDVNYNFYCSKTTLSNISVSVDILEDITSLGGEVVETDLTFYDRNKEACIFSSIDEFKSFKVAITRYVDNIDKNRIVLLKSIEDAESKEDLEKIDINKGW